MQSIQQAIRLRSGKYSEGKRRVTPQYEAIIPFLLFSKSS